ENRYTTIIPSRSATGTANWHVRCGFSLAARSKRSIAGPVVSRLGPTAHTTDPTSGQGSSMSPQQEACPVAVRTWLHRFVARILLYPITAASLVAADPITVPPPATVKVPVYSLQDCLAIARSSQPSLSAAASSLAAAQTAQYGLNRLPGGRIFARDLPVRREQAALGVNAASANLCQVERDVACS